MKNLRNFLTTGLIVFLVFLTAGCDSKRPETDDFTYNIEVRSILSVATATINSEGKVLRSSTTDETGIVTFEKLSEVAELKVKVCGGTTVLVSSDEPVSWNGCLTYSFTPKEENNIIVVDLLSSFIDTYDSETSDQEWLDYLNLETSVFPEINASLTDSTKRYLWTQAFSLISKEISDANGVTPETSLSTEKLFNMIISDLGDDNVINSSTGESFSTLSIGSAIFKDNVPNQLKNVSADFTESDLEEYSKHLSETEAVFLGDGSSSGTSNIEISVSITTDNDSVSDLYYGDVNVKAQATDDKGKSITYLECLVDEVSIDDDDTTKSGFSGIIDTTAFEDDSTHTVKCSAGNGVEIEEVQKSFKVNNSVPVITVYTYVKDSTTVIGETEETPASGNLDIIGSVESEHVITSFACTLNDTSLSDLNDKTDSFKATIKTTDFLDGKNILKCDAVSLAGEGSIEKDLYISNRVAVTIKPYITNPLKKLDKISVYDLEGNSVGDVFPDSDDKYKTTLVPGKYIFETKGGFYDNIVLETEKAFTGSIKTRADIEINESAVVVITPLTTIREYYLNSLTENSSVSDPESLSIQILNNHFSSTFNIMEEPENQKTMNNKTLTYIALAAFERLSQKIAVDIGLGQSEILIENLLTAFARDFESDHILNGNDGAISIGLSTSKYDVDSYLFRKDYAVALKKFLQEAVNTTTLTKLTDMIANISMDDEPKLFPEEDLPIIVSDLPPSLSDLKYSIFVDEVLDEEFTDYSVSPDYDVPVFYNSFQITFTVTPEANQVIKASGTNVEQVLSTSFPSSEFDIVKIDQDSEDYTGPIVYIFEISILDEIDSISEEHPDGRRDFVIKVADESEEKGETVFEAILDRVPPSLVVTVPDHPVKTADALFSWEIVETVEGEPETKEKYMRDLYYKIVHVSEDITSSKFYPIDPNTLFEGSANLDSFITTLTPSVSVESDYSIKVVATDKAGNETIVDNSVITVDNTPPVLNLSIESDGNVLADGDYTKAAEVTFTETNTDVHEIKWNLTCSGSLYSSGDWTTEKSKHVSGLPANTDNCSLVIGARDLAGNETEVTRTFKIDMTPPYIVLSQGISQGVTYYSVKTLQLKVADTLSGVYSVKLLDPDTSHNCTLNGDYYDCPVEVDGEHTYTIVLTDNAGNVFNENRTFILELDPPPALTINLTEIWMVNSGVVTWTQNPSATYVCKILNSSNVEVASCNFASNIASLISESGQYKIKVTSMWTEAPASKSISYSEDFHKFNPDDMSVQFFDYGTTSDKVNVGSCLPTSVKASTGGNGMITEYYFYFGGHYVWGQSLPTADQLTASSTSHNYTSVFIEDFVVKNTVALGKYTELIFKYKLEGSESIYTMTFDKTFRFSSSTEKFYVSNWTQTKTDAHPASVYEHPNKPLTLSFNVKPLKYMNSITEYGCQVGLFDSSAYSELYYGGNAVNVFSRKKYGSNSFSCNGSTSVCTITYDAFEYEQKDGVICGSSLQCGHYYKVDTDGYSYCDMNYHEGYCNGGICDNSGIHYFRYIPEESEIRVDTIDGHDEAIEIPSEYRAAQDDNDKFYIYQMMYQPCVF